MLTVDVNGKGVLDIDTVKGCTAGIAAHGPKGCYQACYAASIAKFRGIDFSRATVRKVLNSAHARMIERAIKTAPLGFFRIGTMGDPCHAWRETVEVVEWLAPYATPIIITKHWKRASDDHLRRLVACGAIINTSVSALDSAAHWPAGWQRFNATLTWAAPVSPAWCPVTSIPMIQLQRKWTGCSNTYSRCNP